MTKKAAFLPSLKQIGNFEIQNSVHAIGTEYVDDRDKKKLMAPDKSFKKNIPKWNLQKTCDGSVFSQEVKQELDIYDLDLLKFMRTNARGLRRPSNTAGTKTSPLRNTS